MSNAKAMGEGHIYKHVLHVLHVLQDVGKPQEEGLRIW